MYPLIDAPLTDAEASLLDGVFSVASFFSAASINSTPARPLHSQWKIKGPSRVIAFGWLALRSKILTLDNLQRRNRILVNACPMCLANEESVDLLLRCKVPQALWTSLLKWFDCSWVCPRDIGRHLEAWYLPYGLTTGKVMCRTSFLAVSWTLWKRGMRPPINEFNLGNDI